MTVKEYIKMTSGISKVNIYDKNGNYVEIDCSATQIVKYVDEEILKVDLTGTTSSTNLDGKELTFVKVSVSIHLANYEKEED